MPRIYVEFSGLDQIGSRCKTVASRVDTIQSNFQRTVRQLDWDIRFESNINSTATQIEKRWSSIQEHWKPINDLLKMPITNTLN